MLPSNRSELIEELDATEERYVRKKLALNGFKDWQRPVAQHWLDERASARQDTAEKTQAYWFRVRVCVAAGSLIVAIVWHFLPIA